MRKRMNFSPESFIKDKNTHYRRIDDLIYQEEITVLDYYVLNYSTLKNI